MNFVAVKAECYSGYKVNEYPRTFILNGRCFQVAEILDRWYEGGRSPRDQKIDYFKVRTSEGLIFLLRYLALFDAWSVLDCSRWYSAGIMSGSGAP